MLKKMLQSLILLVLFVHNSLAFGLYDDIDDNRLRRTGNPGFETTATTIKEKDCKKDILILWDNSVSVGKYNFRDVVLPFLIKLVNSTQLNVAKNGTHLGFITFSNENRTRTLLNIGTKNKTEAKDLISWLMKLNYKKDLEGNQTYTGKAFKLANDIFKLPSPSNHRPGIDDVIMLFTDGRPNPNGPPEHDQIPVANNFSAKLKNKNVKIIALAVGDLSTDIENHNLLKNWASLPSKDYFYETNGWDLNNIEDKLVNPLCKIIVPTMVPSSAVPSECVCNNAVTLIAYAEPGQQTGKVSWKKQEADCTKGIVATPGLVDPPGAISGGRYSLGKHVITYPFSYEVDGKPKDFECLVNFTVFPCECPSTQTVKAKIESGHTTVDVSWQEPSPSCPTTPRPKNTSESLSVGTYTRTYKYTYSIPEIHSFDIECHVNIIVTVPGKCVCNKPLTPFIAYAEPGQQTGKVSWKKQEADCTKGIVATPDTVDPPSAISGGRYSLGKHVITYPFSYKVDGKPKYFTCLVNFTVVRCECPITQTVNTKVEHGHTTVAVSWKEPKPNCRTTPSPDNPKTSESLSVGTHTRTYKYTYSIPEIHSFDIECHVHIIVKGFCGKTTYDAATHVCCCGKIHHKKPGYRCCGLEYYNTLRESCCNSEQAILMPHGTCPEKN